jgi:DNA-binding NarL/FixJ family response regulator
LQRVAEGASSSQIAAQLQLSAKTIDTYRSRFMRKLGLRSMVDLVKFALQHNLISPH